MRKQKISSVFHRRKIQNSTAAPADVDADDSKPPIQKLVPSPADSDLPIGRINIIQRGQPSIKVIQFAANANNYCATNARSAIDSPPISVVDTPAATITMNTPDRGVPVSCDKYETKSTTFNGNVDVDSKPYHLSAREQIWYKNQMYLHAKQQQQQQQQQQAASSRVKSTSTPDTSKKRYSPSGVDEFELVDGDSTQPGDSKRKIIRSKQNLKRNNDYHDDSDDDYTDGDCSGDRYNDDDDNDDNTWTTTPSRILPDDEHSCTTQFTSVLDDDTRTNLSSFLFDEDESCSDSSEIFDGLALDPAIPGYSTTATESESIFSTLDDGASMSYVFELVDDGGKQHRKYQLGVGHNPDISGRSKKYPRSSTKSRKTDDECMTTSTITSRPQMNRREKNFTVDSNSVVGDILQVLSEEVAGTLKDAKLALDQVVHAFCISLDNVDQITDELSVARLELLDLCYWR